MRRAAILITLILAANVVYSHTIHNDVNVDSITHSDDAGPNDCSRGIDESNRESCS